MKIFTFNGHHVALADVLNASVTCDYHATSLHVELEMKGGAVMSLNVADSAVFMEEFLAQVRREHKLT
jgi:hypothetical protein